MCFPSRLSLLLLLLLAVSGLSAQNEKVITDNRPDEKAVYLEKEFIEAKQELLLRNYDDALAKFLELLNKDNENPAIHFEIAQLYIILEQEGRALSRAARAAELAPDNVYCVELYADLLEKQKNYLKAAELYEKLVKKYPQAKSYYLRWAHLLRLGEKANQGLKVYYKMEEVFGKSQEINEYIYLSHIAMGKEKKALRSLEEMKDFAPDDPETWLKLARYYQAYKNPEEAKDYYRKALELDPSNSEAAVALTEVFRSEKDTLRYFQSLQALFSDRLQNAETKQKLLFPLVQQYESMSTEEQKRAIRELGDIFVRLHPEHSKAAFYQGLLLHKERRYVDASEALEEALKQNSNSVELWYYLLDSYKALDRYDMLSKRGEQMTEYFPSQAIGYYFQALGLHGQKNYKKLLSVLEPARMIAANNENLSLQVDMLLAYAYAQERQSDKAEKLFRAALDKYSDNPELLHFYSLSLLLRADKLEEASDYAQQALNIDPNNADYLDALARIFYKQGNYRQAKELWERALNLNREASERSEYWESLGDAYYKEGDRTKALELWKKAREKGGKSALLARKIETGQLYE